MLDRERILGRLAALDGYERELRQVVPATFAEYVQSVEKRRACERLLQIAIECVIDICHLVVAGLRLGLPAEEDDLFQRLEQARVISPPTAETLRRMRGLRNVLVHEYEDVDNVIVFRAATGRLQDLAAFRREIARALERPTDPNAS